MISLHIVRIEPKNIFSCNFSKFTVTFDTFPISSFEWMAENPETLSTISLRKYN